MLDAQLRTSHLDLYAHRPQGGAEGDEILRQVRQRERGRKRALNRFANIASVLSATGQVYP